MNIGTRSTRARWWQFGEGDGHSFVGDTRQRGQALFHTVKALDTEQAWRKDAYLIFARLYSGTNLASLYDYGQRYAASPWLADPYGGGSRLALNVTQACCEAGAAKIAKNKPRPMFLTSGGNWTQARRAKNLTKFVDGMFDAGGVYKVIRQMFVDATVFGTGVAKVFADRSAGTIECERVLPHEVLVDEGEGIYGKPRSMYHQKYVYVDALWDMVRRWLKGKPQQLAEAEEAIRGSCGEDPANGPGYSGDMIKVVEGWHLPSGHGAEDGRHVIAVQGGTLLDEPWTKDWFPLVLYTVRPRLSGMWGIGWAEDLVGIQVEINKILRRISRSADLFAIPRLFTKPGAIVKKVNNIIGTHYETEDPRSVNFETPPAMSSDVYQLLWDLYTRSFEMVGLSQLSATSTKPAGLDAAVALREFHDIEAERFALPGQRLEEAALEIAMKQIDLSRDMYESGRDVRVRAPGTKFIEVLDFSSVNLREDQYVMRAFPTSLLPTTPAGRLQTVQEMVEAGFIDPDFANSLLDFPDTERAISLRTAALEDVFYCMEQITEKEEYETPDEYMGLDLAIRIGHATLLKSRRDNAPAEVMRLLRMFIDDAKAMQKQLGADQAVQPPMMPVAQPGQPAIPGAVQPGQGQMMIPGAEVAPTPALQPAM